MVKKLILIHVLSNYILNNIRYLKIIVLVLKHGIQLQILDLYFLIIFLLF